MRPEAPAGGMPAPLTRGASGTAPACTADGPQAALRGAGARRGHLCFVAPHIYPVLVEGSGIPFVGGAEVQQTVQIKALARAGYRISVIARDDGQPELVERDGLRIHRLPDPASRGWPGTRFLHPRLTDLVRLLARIGPDIVFNQTASEQVLAAAVYARLAGKRFVYAGASDPDFHTGRIPGLSRWHATMYRMGLRGADAIVTQNVSQQAMLRRHFGRDSHLIQNGYEEPGCRPAAFQGHVLWAATVKPLKRPALLVELARALPELRFRMVGGPGVTPDAQAYFEAIARAAADVPNLEMKGHVPYAQVGGDFDGASVFVNTSEYEGFPNTFLQAWIRGVPSVSFVRPESAPGESGTLGCEDFDGLVKRVRGLALEPARWERESAAARAFFLRHHTMEAALQRYVRLFDGLLPP